MTKVNDDDLTTTATTTSASTFSVIPKSNAEYGAHEYWVKRYEHELEYEWLLSFQELLPLLQPFLDRYCARTTRKRRQQHDQVESSLSLSSSSSSSSSSFSSSPSMLIDKSQVRILIIGCGNSPFSASLYDAGYTNITNVDYASSVISHMQQQHHVSRPLMHWYCVDLHQLSQQQQQQQQQEPSPLFPMNHYDLIIDKATYDAICAKEGTDPWHPYSSVVQSIYHINDEISRILSLPTCQHGDDNVNNHHHNHHDHNNSIDRNKSNSNDSSHDSNVLGVDHQYNQNTICTTFHCQDKSYYDDGGIFLQISLVQPHFRLPYLLGTHTHVLAPPPTTPPPPQPTTTIDCSINDTRTDQSSLSSSSSNEQYSSRFQWKVETQPITLPTSHAASFGYYMYIARKVSC
jgi:hypothetical protein